MADTAKVALITGEYVKAPDGNFFMQNGSFSNRLPLRVVTKATKPTVDDDTYLLLDVGDGLVRETATDYWIMSPHDDCRAPYLIRDLVSE